MKYLCCLIDEQKKICCLILLCIDGVPVLWCAAKFIDCILEYQKSFMKLQ